MSIGAVEALGARAGWISDAAGLPAPGLRGAGLAAPTAATPSAAGAGFGDLLARGVTALQDSQATSDRLAVSAATGDLTDVHDYMIASTKASLMTELTVAVRNKAVEAFNEIMRMPV